MSTLVLSEQGWEFGKMVGMLILLIFANSDSEKASRRLGKCAH